MRLPRAPEPYAVTRTWRLPARFEHVATVRGEICAAAAEAGALVDDIALVEFAAGELVANAMEHGTGEFVEIEVDVRSDSAVLAVTNDGPIFEQQSVDLVAVGFEENGRGLAILVAFGCTVTVECPRRHACTVTAQIPFHGTSVAGPGPGE